MALRANTYLSATRFSDYYRSGVTLKSRTLKCWIKRKGLTQKFVADQLGMSKKKFIRKLYRRHRFNQKEITALIRLMKARAAIRVIWFPTLQEKKRIEKYVWERQMSKKNSIDFADECQMPSDRKRRAIELQQRESGENWEQSEAFEEFIFEADELPSRRFMRRRSNG